MSRAADDDGTTARLTALEARVAALEASSADPAGPADAAGQDSAETFWALHELRRQVAAHGLDGGAVLLTGAVTTPAGAAEWQVTRAVADLTEAGSGAPDALDQPAAVLAALGSAVRLQLLLRVLAGPPEGVGTAELAQGEGLGTSGQVYHHVRQLLATGWLRSVARGRFAVPAERVVPLLVALALAGR